MAIAMTRRRLDAYYTPHEMIDPLEFFYPELWGMRVIEPCCGDGAISDQFPDCYASDIDPFALANSWSVERFCGYDATVHGYPECDAFVTNPPFNQAIDILKNLRRQSNFVALFLRLTFLEPTQDRGEYLVANPPDHLIVCPRVSFTGDSKTDSVTCAWMIWGGSIKGIHVWPRNG